MSDTFLTGAGLDAQKRRKELPVVPEVRKPVAPPPPPPEPPKQVSPPHNPPQPPPPPPPPPRYISRNESMEEVNDEYDKKKAQREWEQILEKVNKPFVKPDHFYSRYPIKPGFGFYKALASAKWPPIETLDVNIPPTFVNTDNQFLIWKDEKTGCLQKKSDALFADFEQKVVQSVKGFQLRDDGELRENNFMTGKDLPIAINRGSAADNGLCTKTVLTYRELEGKRHASDSAAIHQQFVIPKGFRASILRLVYYTNNSKESKGNRGYRITNNNDIFDPNPMKSLLTKSTLSTENPNSFNYTLVRGASLKDFEIMAKKMIKYLERAYNVRICDAVFDFMTDFDGINWMINLKALNVDETSLNMLENAYERPKKNLDDLTCSVYCKLCGMIFKKDDASRTLTYKLMWELVQHLKKRGIQLSNIVVKHQSTKPCRICDLCYMLVVSEHELIDVEQRIARAQNIPLGEGIYRVQADTKPMHRPPLLADKLHQWRLMIYFNYVAGLANNQKISSYANLHIQFKFGDTKSVFPLRLLRSSKKPPKLAYKDDFTLLKRQNNTTSAAQLSAGQTYNSFNFMAPHPESAKSLRKQEPQVHLHVEKEIYYDLRLLRVFYLFSETPDMEKFLKETQLVIRITEGTDWNNFISEGAQYPLRSFRNANKSGQRCENEVLCFFENMNDDKEKEKDRYKDKDNDKGKDKEKDKRPEQYCTLHMTLGLVCDGIYRTENLNLYKYNNIYFPDDDYFNSNPFPPEWMEIFEESEKLIEDDLARENQVISYTPKCAPREIKKMVDFEMGSQNPHLHNVKSQTKMLWTQPNQDRHAGSTGTFETFHLLEQRRTLQPQTAHGQQSTTITQNNINMTRPFSAVDFSSKKKGIDFGNGKIRTVKEGQKLGRNQELYREILSKPPGEEENKELDQQIHALQQHYTDLYKDNEQSRNEKETPVMMATAGGNRAVKILLEDKNRSGEEEEILRKYANERQPPQSDDRRKQLDEINKGKKPGTKVDVQSIPPIEIGYIQNEDMLREAHKKL